MRVSMVRIGAIRAEWWWRSDERQVLARRAPQLCLAPDMPPSGSATQCTRVGAICMAWHLAARDRTAPTQTICPREGTALTAVRMPLSSAKAVPPAPAPQEIEQEVAAVQERAAGAQTVMLQKLTDFSGRLDKAERDLQQQLVFRSSSPGRG